MFHVVQNQLKKNICTLAFPDVPNPVNAALSSNTYLEPVRTAIKSILYPLLFEELKILL